MADVFNKFSDGQLFWLFVLLIIVGAEVLKSLFKTLLKPLQVWMRSLNKKALRDKFAAHALQVLIAWEHSPAAKNIPVTTITQLCIDAYNYADTMMELREGKADEAVNNIINESNWG